MSTDCINEMENNLPTEKIVFKSKVRKNLRQRQRSTDADNPACDTEASVSLEEIKQRQKLRERQHGINVAALALGKKIPMDQDVSQKDRINPNTGGLINMQALKSGQLKKDVDDAYDVGIGTQFSAETNKRDEDEEMMKYIEQELQRRKGVMNDNNDNEEATDLHKYLSPEEAALMSLPDHLRQSSSNRSEEMLSNQMLNGIPEIDLGIDAKIRNIEATEEAKRKLVLEQDNKKEGPSQFVPTNMAVNFMQHNRFNIEENHEAVKRKPKKEVAKNHTYHPYVQIGAGGIKRATDDYHYDKFKKQFRRY